MATILRSTRQNRFARIKLPVGALTQALLDPLKAFSAKINDDSAYGFTGKLTRYETNHPAEFKGPFRAYGLGVHVFAEDMANAAAASEIVKLCNQLNLVWFPAGENGGEGENLGPVYGFPVPFGAVGHDTGTTASTDRRNGGIAPVMFKEPVDFEKGDAPVVGFAVSPKFAVSTTTQLYLDVWLIGEGFEPTAG